MDRLVSVELRSLSVLASLPREPLLGTTLPDHPQHAMWKARYEAEQTFERERAAADTLWKATRPSLSVPCNELFASLE